MADIFQIVENNGTPKDIGDSKARANIGEPFSTSKSYVVGDECLYEGVLYRFTSDHSAGSWNSGHVTSINLADDKVNRSGDTMTGNLTIEHGFLPAEPVVFLKNTEITRGTAPSSIRFVGSYSIKDKNGANTGYLCSLYDSSKRMITRLLARNTNSNQTGQVDNYLDIIVGSNGEKSVYLSDVSSWLKALGLEITSGTFTINTTNCSQGSIAYRRIGNLVTFWTSTTIKLKNELTAVSVVVATIPSGIRPINNGFYGVAGNDLYYGTTWITAAGDFKFARPSTINSWPTTDGIYMSGSYYIA